MVPADLTELILFGGWKTRKQLASMSEDDKRNTVIVKLNERSSMSISDVQAFPSTGDLNSLLGFGAISVFLENNEIRSPEQLVGMNYNDNRNTLIDHLNINNGFTVPDLQAMADLDLVRIAQLGQTAAPVPEPTTVAPLPTGKIICLTG